MSNLLVQNIKHTNGTTAQTIDSSGRVNIPGHVMQVVSNNTATQTSLASANFLEYSALNTSITPSSTSSKIVVALTIFVGNGNDDNYNQFRLKRDSTEIGLGTQVGSSAITTFAQNGPYTHAIYEIHSVAYLIMDSPSTTSQVTYKLFARAMGNSTRTMYFNRPHNTADVNRSATTSTMTLMEIAQ